MDRRKVSYTEHRSEGQIGHCFLITGGMMSQAIAIVERQDGTIAEIPVRDVQFIDIPMWSKIGEGESNDGRAD